MVRARRSASRALGLALVLVVLVPATHAWALFELEWGTVPALPTLSGVTLNAKAQTGNTTMTNFSVTDARLVGKNGWNITVQGQSGSGKSATFAQYCPETKCGSDSKGYVGGGQTLVANSLTLNSTSAKFSGGSGGTPTLQCSSSCNVDSASAVKVASAPSGAGGTWTTSGWTSSSLTLATPTTMRVLTSPEVYRVNLLWTLGTGP